MRIELDLDDNEIDYLKKRIPGEHRKLVKIDDRIVEVYMAVVSPQTEKLIDKLALALE